MPSYKNLAILTLAASTVSPALCAPTRESQKQSRTINTGLLTDLGLSFLGGAVPSFLMHMFGGGSTASSTATSATRSIDASEARAVSELEGRAFGNHGLTEREMGRLGTFLSGTALSLLGSIFGSIARRGDVSLEEMIASGLLGKRDVAPEDVIAALKLFTRALDELD